MTAPANATWTAERVKALGVKTDLVTAYSIALGGGKNRAWQAYHAGELPFRTLRVGRRVVVPVSELLSLLGIADVDPVDRPTFSVVPGPPRVPRPHQRAAPDPSAAA